MNRTSPPLLLRFSAALLTILTLTAAAWMPIPASQSVNSQPPDRVVKLVFIHHSTGENWLRDDYGGLGLALSQNNYFVSDTNYGWGPDSIGDRTDIPNWTEWFASASTPTFTSALFTESGQNSSYTRTLADPGGENLIVVFKSCFPNSALEGNPNDSPDPQGELTVGHAKYVYNTILQYFATRPDKLFVVITAPPLSDSTYAENARAFNDWLLNDWLRENNYSLSNVAVFDFYNILTDKNAHHHIVNGQVEHVSTRRNTLAYPSGDDHPSERGSRKATEEFIPMLNYFYHRWQDSGTAASPVTGAAQPLVPTAISQPTAPPPAGTFGLIDDFEGGPSVGTTGWEGYFQDYADTQINCEVDSNFAHAGSASLQFQFEVAANTWATCGFYFESAQDWSAGQGISFYLRADRAGLPLNVDLYGGSPGGRTTYSYSMQVPAGSDSDWVLVEIPWTEIKRAEWEENAGTSFDPRQVAGFSIGLAAPESQRLSGKIWLDDLTLLGVQVESAPTNPPMEQPPATEESAPRSGLPCVGSLILPLWLVAMAWIFRRG